MAMTAARRSRRHTTRASTTASSWSGSRRSRSAAMPVSRTFVTCCYPTLCQRRPRTGVAIRRPRSSMRTSNTSCALLINPRLKPFSLVLDAGSGIGGIVAPALFDRLPCHTTRLCFDVDGSFPNHEANPLIEKNRRDLVEAVRAQSADAGIAWDGDADRCFFVDGTGDFISGDFITALLAEAVSPEDTGRHHRVRRACQSRGQRRCGDTRRTLPDEPCRSRLLQETDARRERRVWGRSHRSLLLSRQLLRRQWLHPRVAHPRAHVGSRPDPPGTARTVPRALLHLWRDQYRTR